LKEAQTVVATPYPLVRQFRTAVELKWSAFGFRPIEILPALLAVAAYLTISNTGLHIPFTYDVGLAYQGGTVAWQTGHPESLPTWISTPFLAMVMALISQLVGERTAGTAATLINCAIFLAAAAVTWTMLRGKVTVWFWWITLLAFAVYAPIASSIFWLQFNLVALALAAAGYFFAGRRPWAAGLLVALSIGIKPLVLLLPFALLWRSETRRGGVWSLAWGSGLLVASQVFLAARAHDWHVLSPLGQLTAYSSRFRGNSSEWVCDPENFSPQSLWCRLSGMDYWSVKLFLITTAILVVIALAAHLTSGLPGRSWAIFGFVCLLSPMLSPIEWSHYQVLLAPMFLVLAYAYVTAGADLVDWVALGTAFALAELSWRPVGTVPGMLRELLTGKPESVSITVNVFDAAALAQFVLLGAAFLWFMRGHPPSANLRVRA
jgi:hypothetical protein